MSGARTEEPTPRRLRDARRRGDVARSRELTAAAALSAGLCVVAFGGRGAFVDLAAFVRASLASAPAEADPRAALLGAFAAFGRVAGPLLLVPAAAAAVAGALQAGGSFGLEPLLPRLERLSPSSGLRRLLSLDGLRTAGIGMAKAAVVALLAWGWLGAAARGIASLPRLDAPLAALPRLLAGLAARVAAVALGLGLLDLWLARRRRCARLRMTRDEVRREAKEDEGDPQHRAERRRLHRAVLEAGPVSKATVVVVNPTHVAVALRHRRGADDPPRVLAKGTGEAAARIRSAARRAGVPVVRDVPLARSLFRLAEVGDEIPEELYDAAAGVLVHVYGLAGEAP